MLTMGLRRRSMFYSMITNVELICSRNGSSSTLKLTRTEMDTSAIRRDMRSLGAHIILRLCSDLQINPLKKERLYLLPPDITGFNLANKVCQECRRRQRSCPESMCQSWQKFDVKKLSDVHFDEQAWAHLVLDADTKVCSA
jgi:hypothetical protein